MADAELMAILRLGAMNWNEWRGLHASAEIDLRDASLSGAQLRAADMSGVNLAKADLRGADFSTANLLGANLSGANLFGAHLNAADLRGAQFQAAHVNQADLRSAELNKANLCWAQLSNTDLSGANLCEARFSGANLTQARLRGAKLGRANLTHAVLSEADLDGADLSHAILEDAILRDANLSGANLSATNLSGANLSYAKTQGASFSGTIFWLTVFGGTSLSGASNLDVCDHRGPSIIDYQTLVISGPLPLTFLRGCGLPDNYIEYLPSLTGRALEFYSCFISYSSKDETIAKRLHADLQATGVRCWFAPHDLRVGDKILDALDAAVRLRDKVLLILSEHAIASDWVEDEVTTAFEEERKRQKTVLFPIRLDDAIMSSAEPWAAKVRQRHVGDFRRWKEHDQYQNALERVKRELRRDVAADEVEA